MRLRRRQPIRAILLLQNGHFLVNGAAQESNLPSRGLHDLTGFEDRLRHRPLPLRDQPSR
jgi:hypothetical protein